jgi:ATP-dependent Lon protease
MPNKMNLRSKKESGESGDKKAAPDRKKPMQKKRSGGWHDDDDESVDSRGNIRGLIVTTTDEEASEAEDVVVQKKRRVLQKSSSGKKQKAAAVASAAAVESESEEEEEERSPKKRPGFLPRPKKSVLKKAKKVEESEEEEEEESEADETEEEEEESEEEDEEAGGPSEIIISMGGYEDDYLKEKMTPKRHNMKKETKDVKKFVELITKPMEEGGIDDQIDEFKRLTEEKQKEMLEVLDRKSTADTTKQSMMFKILTMKTNPDIQNIILSKYRTMEMMEPMSGEYFKLRSWLEKATELPLGLYREIPVKLGDGTETCGAFMEKARRCLGEAIYGQEEAKMQILQFIASKIANPEARGLSLLLAGPPGIGKTSLIKNGIAKALEWPFQFISLGGDSDA